MIAVYTASGKNNRHFFVNQKKKALKYYYKIKNLERTELHYLFYAIFPENLYSLELDRKQANRNRKIFLQSIKKEEKCK